jgi:predicted transcriptional regulator
MLNKLFGSECRVKILKIFLLNPEKKYYTRQLARELDLQVNAVRRELDNLSKIGIIKAEDNQNSSNKRAKKYYYCLTDFLIFNELKSVFSKSQLFSSQDFIDKLQKLYTPKFLMLNGFFVGDNLAPIDLLIVGRINKTKLIELINSLEKEVSREINYTIMTETEFIYRLQIVDRFLNDLFKRKKIIITGQELLEKKGEEEKREKK